MTDNLAALEELAKTWERESVVFASLGSDISSAESAVFSNLAKDLRAAIALMRGQSWQPISEAPVCDFIEKEAPKCLVYGKGVGVHMGRAWRYPGGEAKAQAFGFHGDWPLTHFCNLPTPPKDSADEQ